MAPRRPRRAPARLTPTVLLLVLAAVAFVLAGRAGWLPGPLAELAEGVAVELGLPPAEQPQQPAPRQPAPGRPGPQAPLDFAAVERDLASVRVEPERRAGYDREAWPHWLTADGSCLTARERVLEAESLERVRKTPDGCGIVGGRWLDLYTQETYTEPAALDIDHLVALQEAHDSGGHAWSRERRAEFANDLSDPRTLIAVGAAVNRAKGAKGPEEWLPPDPAYRCRFVADWVSVKARWGLSMDESERVAIGNILADCRR
ncbi:MAG TPA: HNH endonuclease family protein [Alphaproteobacteria bacterium]|nr:HNH endonuclease family protein [Alphaproteobacteria bacterium]